MEVFARRLQVQERITEQVADAVQEALTPRGVAVMLDAAHFCMMMRGVGKQHARTTTHAWRGVYASDAQLRTEFLIAAGSAYRPPPEADARRVGPTEPA